MDQLFNPKSVVVIGVSENPNNLARIIVGSLFEFQFKGEIFLIGKKEGILVSLAPALTDLPIIAATIFFMSRISGSDFVLGIISLAGAFFVGYLAYKNITIRDMA